MSDGILAPGRRGLTLGIALCVTIVAFQGVGVITALPRAARDLGGLELYGWAVTSFSLAAVVGAVLAGREADKIGLLRPLLAGAALFGAGSAACALAPTWPALLAGRAVQGAGDGAIAAIAYAAVGRAYPDALRPRMFAVMSTAWVVPALVGPAASGALADAGLWRLVFVALVPILVVATVLAARPLRRVGAPAEVTPGAGAVDAVRAAAGLGLLIGGLGARGAAGGLVAILGVLVMAAPLRRILPWGTLRLRAGVGLGVASRGLLAGAFLGAEAYVTLGLVEQRGWSASRVGLAITAAALTWSAGSWLQARLDERHGADRRPARMVVGFALVSAGIAICGATVLVGAIPGAFAPLGWAIGGLGMGLSFATASSLTFAAAAESDIGAVSAALGVIETIAVAAVTGFAGAYVALGYAQDWSPAARLGPVFAVALGVTVLGALRWRATVRA